MNDLTPRLNSVESEAKKNWIINGDMQVSQRGDIDTAPVVYSGEQFHIDRFKTYNGGASTIQRVSASIDGQIISKALRVEATAEISHIQVRHPLEEFQKLIGNAFTFSAYVKSNISTRLSVSCYGASVDYVESPQHSGGGEWERLSVTVTPDNLTSILLNTIVHSTVSGDYFEVTGLKLELGSIATDFVSRSFAEELLDCLRFYEKSYNYEVATGTVTNTGAISSRYGVAGGTGTEPESFTGVRMFPKRAIPVHIMYNPQTGAANEIYLDVGAKPAVGGHSTRRTFTIVVDHVFPTDSAQNYSAHWTADAEIY